MTVRATMAEPPRRGRPRRPLAVVLLCALTLSSLLGACTSPGDDSIELFAEPESQIAYEVELEGAPSDEIADLLVRSLALYRQQERGAPSLALLRRRAEGDVATAQTILRSRGYYRAEIETEVRAGETREDEAGADAPLPATARMVIAAGSPLTLSRHSLQVIETGGTPADPLDAGTLGSPVGAAAAAAGIVSAEQAGVAELRRKGRPYATFRGRDALADLEAGTLEVDSVIAAGPAYAYGPVGFEGAPGVDRDFLRTYLPWAEGARYDSAEIETYQERLFATGLFSGARVSPPDTPPEGETVPIAVALEEAPPRSVALGARFSTDEGPAVRASFEHRNLFGAGERLGLLAEASLDEQLLETTYVKPQYLRPGQDLTTGLELRRQEEDAFDELGATLTLGLSRRLTERWTVGAGGLLEASLIDDAGEETEAYLAGLPVFVAYDSTDDRLDATRGIRSRADATPFAGIFEDEFTTFLRLEARGSAYYDIFDDKIYVLAGRARLGTILAGGLEDVPQTRRFYSGGGGSVRGYEEDLIGPLDAMNDPVGGRSVAEIGGEIRARVFGDLGVVAFADGGVVSTDMVPDLGAGFRVAAGLGLRYHSPIGPIRIDVAFPVNGRDVDDSFQAYLSIGQAF